MADRKFNIDEVIVNDRSAGEFFFEQKELVVSTVLASCLRCEAEFNEHCVASLTLVKVSPFSELEREVGLREIRTFMSCTIGTSKVDIIEAVTAAFAAFCSEVSDIPVKS